MKERLIAYLLNDLSADERIQVEASLQQDPQWQQELERLKSCIEECENESDDAANPPGDLTARTCCLIQHVHQRGADRVDQTDWADRAGQTDRQDPLAHLRKRELCPRASGEFGPQAFAPESAPGDLGHRWSLMDLAAVGGILAILVMLLLPALHQGREASRRLTCKNNLRTIGQALILYAEQHRRGLPHVAPQENAGIFTVRLIASGMIDRHQLTELLVCPSSPLAETVFSGQMEIRIPTARQLALAGPQKLPVIQRRMSGSYAYRLGYFERGIYHHIPFTGRSDSPMLADAPAPQTDGFYSSYHGGCGSNCGAHVLFQDWSVRFYRPCMSNQQRDNIYLNSDQQQAAGKEKGDIVLGRSEVRPDGLTWRRWP